VHERTDELDSPVHTARSETWPRLLPAAGRVV